MPDPGRAVAAYLAAWNCPDPAQRADLLTRCWTPEADYVDPNVELHGAAELEAHIVRLLTARPGARVELLGGVAAHHTWASFAWQVVLADGSVAVSGIDAVEFAEDGRLRRVVGFFGGTPPWPGAPPAT